MANRTDVFLSHNWGNDETGRNNHNRVSLINKGLKEIGYQTWFDEERMEGNLAQKMARGIEQTNSVIAFITKQYHDKVKSEDFNNCKLEFNYAWTKKKKSMIVVVMEQCMLDQNIWTGPVGFYLCGEFYIDMSGNLENEIYFSEQLKRLQMQLQKKGIQPHKGMFCSFFTFLVKTLIQ